MKRPILICAVLLAGCGSAVSVTSSTPRMALRPASTSTTTTAPMPTPTGRGALGPPSGAVIDHSANSACGTELWARKTLTDPSSKAIDPTPHAISHVSQLGAVSDAGAGGASRVGIELHVYVFTGTLVEAKQEADDDYHVVMRDSAGKTLVTEYPSPVCSAHANAVARTDMASARAMIEKACGPFNKMAFKMLKGTATVTGVGFYDFDHGQTGRASLGDGHDVELHPVIGFRGSCS